MKWLLLDEIDIPIQYVPNKQGIWFIESTPGTQFGGYHYIEPINSILNILFIVFLIALIAVSILRFLTKTKKYKIIALVILLLLGSVGALIIIPWIMC